MRPRCTLLLATCAFALCLPARAALAQQAEAQAAAIPAPAPIVLSDDAGDGDGPGRYLMPRGKAFDKGSFDLTQVTLTPDGDHVDIEVRLAGRPAIARNARAARDTWGDYVLTQVDIYVDTDRESGSGYQRTIPGRRVRLAPRDAWERCVVITGLPDRVRSGLGHADALLGRSIWVTAPTRTSGKRLRARVPIEAFGGPLSPDWGFVVLTSSVTLSTSLKGVVLDAGEDANVYTREVTASPGACDNWDEAPDGRPCTFGGCRTCEGHPRVLDAIVRGDSQEQLAAFGPARPAVLHAVVPSGRGTVEVPPPDADGPSLRRRKPQVDDITRPLPCAGGGRFPVTDASDELVTVLAPARKMFDGITPGRIGELLGPKGETIGKAVVVRRSGKVLFVEWVDEPGTAPAAVRFPCDG